MPKYFLEISKSWVWFYMDEFPLTDFAKILKPECSIRLKHYTGTTCHGETLWLDAAMGSDEMKPFLKNQSFGTLLKFMSDPNINLHEIRFARGFIDYGNVFGNDLQISLPLNRFEKTLSDVLEQAGMSRGVISVIKEYVRRPVSNTANKYLKKVKAVFNRAVKEQLIPSSPGNDLKIKFQKGNRVFLTEEELKKMKEHSLADNPSMQLVKDIFLFTVATGLRYSDVKKLKASDVTEDKDGTLWISGRQQKTGDPIDIFMIEPAKEIYNKYEASRKETGFVIPTICIQKVNSHLKCIAQLCGINKRLTHHVGRHTFATTITLANGLDIATVSYMLGHSSLKTTQIYAHMTRKNLDGAAKKLGKIYSPMPPLAAEGQ